MANLQQVGFTSPYSAEEDDIARRRKMAELLQAQGLKESGGTEFTPQGWAIKKSPWDGLAKGAQAALGAYQGMKSTEMAKALQERRQTDRTTDMTALAAMLRGSPGAPASSEQIVDEQAAGGMGAPAQINAPAVAPRPGGQIDPAMMSQLKSPEMQNTAMQMYLQQIQRENAPPQRVDLGDKIGLVNAQGQIVGTLPKGATPDATMREAGDAARHATPSGGNLLSAQTALQTHATPSGGALLADNRARSEGALGRGVTMRGQDLTDARARDAVGNDKFGPPTEVSGPNGPMLVMQNKKDGSLVDANTRQPIAGVGPKIGETAQKQQTGVSNTQSAITEYRTALKNMNAADIASPNARARMGTVYNNMLLQAKEAYNLGVLNGPDYMILQEVITNPVSWKGGVTSKKALDDQAAKLDEIMGKIGTQITRTQTGQNRRADDDPLGIRNRQ